MPAEITFIRHGETEANLARRWQGQNDSALSARGLRQVDRLAARVGQRPFDLVISSDLGRAVATAGSFAPDAEVDVGFREAHVGGWEGLNRAEIEERFGDQMIALRAGEDVKMGGGESYGEFTGRVDAAITALAGRLDDGDRVAVVTHGGVIGAVTTDLLGIRWQPRPHPIRRIINTSLTTVRAGGGAAALAVFNDDAHLDGDFAPVETTGRRIALIRHGETVGNVDGRWQGTTDGRLTERGKLQAKRLAAGHPAPTTIYASPLSRAAYTAAALGDRNGLEPITRDALAEMHFGDWEDLRPEEIEQGWPEDYRRIYGGGNDEPRGSTGETYGGAAARFAGALDAIHAEAGEGPVAVVTHGGITRAYLTEWFGLGFAGRSRLAHLDNTAATWLTMNHEGPVLDSHNVAPHLDR